MNIGPPTNKFSAFFMLAASSSGGFLLLWLGINLGVWALWVGFAASTSAMLSSAALSYAVLFVLGSALGLGQWLLLRQRFLIIWYEWIAATAVGLGLGLIGLIWAALQDLYIIFSAPGSPILEWDPLLGGFILGLALGLCQSITWRPNLRHGVLWIVINSAGWAVGMFLPQWFVFWVRGQNSPLLSTLFPVAFAALATGFVLLWFSGGYYELDSGS